MEFYLATHQEVGDGEKQYLGTRIPLLSYALESFITTTSTQTTAIFNNNEEVLDSIEQVKEFAIIVQPSNSEFPLVRIEQCAWTISVEKYGIVVAFDHQPHEISRMLASDCNSDDRFRSDCWETFPMQSE